MNEMLTSFSNNFPLYKERNNDINQNVIMSKVELNQNNQTIKGVMDNIIAIVFTSTDQAINFPVACTRYDFFSNIEEKLYNEFPQLRQQNIFFIAN